MYHSKLKNGNTLAVVFLLLVSLVVRFTFSVTHISFGQDIARDNWLIEQRILNRNLIVDYGLKTSVGNFYLPPLYYQIHVFFSLLSNNDPLTMQWVVTFVEALSPLLVFLIIKELFGTRLALLSGLLAIIVPIPLQYGVTAWNPNMIPFFSLLLLYSFIQIIKYKKLWFIPILCFAFICTFQFHFQSAVHIPFVCICSIYTLKKLRSKKLIIYWLIGIILIIVSLIPYGFAELNSHFANTQAILKYFTQEHSQYFDRISKPAYVFTFFPKFFDRLVLGKESFHSIFGICIFFGGLFFLLVNYRTTKNSAALSVLVYFICIFFMLRLFKGDKLDYHLSTLYFMPMILLASVLSVVRSRFVVGSIYGFIFFSLGMYLSQWNTYDDLSGLKNTIAFIQSKSPSQSVRFIFHDDDYINIVFFGVKKYSNLNIDPYSTTVIDICNNREVCVWDTSLNSNYSLAYSKVAAFKADADYQQISYRYGNVPFQVIIGSINNTSAKLDKSGYIYQGEQGSDFLMQY